MQGSRRALFCALVAAASLLVLIAPAHAALRGGSTDGHRGLQEEALHVDGLTSRPPARRLPPATTAAPAAPAPGAAAPGAPPGAAAPTARPPTAPAAPPTTPAPPAGGARPNNGTVPTIPTASTKRDSANTQPPPPLPNLGPAGWPVPPGWNPAGNAGPLGSTQCDAITPKSTLAADQTCPRVFRAFVSRTTEGAWMHQNTHQREETMNTFCSTTCGQTYTETLTARRRGCYPPTPRGHGAAMVPDGPTGFPTSYPGLRLGCVMDPVDRQFCAVKMANPQAHDCHFYMTCCYGELAAQAGGNGVDPAFFQAIDRICPGSAKYRNMLCV